MSVPAAHSVALQPDSWQAALAQVCTHLLQEKKQILLCITGKSGAGKSTLGKLIRKKGLPGLQPRKIGVIDDGVLAVPLFGIFTRRIKSRSRERDNLAPFSHFLKNKKMVVYVNTKPERRLDRCDVALRLRLPEEIREQRLNDRDHDGGIRFRSTVNADDEVGIQADHVFDLCLVESHDPAPLTGAQSSMVLVPFLSKAAPDMANWASYAAECCS
ncbi:AAA family ATPase [Prosthecobacter sp. SYSU 5D2]|uniref:AAA family ATPase n=1 Tax=Prosthecobacter sp. SYSU 5D2 TaxID=3134134 RepID=UPI0031FE84D8